MFILYIYSSINNIYIYIYIFGRELQITYMGGHFDFSVFDGLISNLEGSKYEF